MKEFKVTFSETVYFTTIIEAESEEYARIEFLEGNFGDCEEIDREYNDLLEVEEYGNDILLHTLHGREFMLDASNLN